MNQSQTNKQFFPLNHLPPIPLRQPVKTKPKFYDDASGFKTAANKLSKGSGAIAIDTERAYGDKYFIKTYLIQIQREDVGSFLIDPTKNPQALAPIIETLAEVEWVIHAADNDLIALKQLGFKCKKLFDTELGGRLLNLPRVNLAYMVELFLELGLEKGFGQADWSKRPLPKQLLNYAALDVEVLIELRNEVEKALRIEYKYEIALQEFEYKRITQTTIGNMHNWKKFSKLYKFNDTTEKKIAANIWRKRDVIAQNLDIRPNYILPDKIIMDLAKIKPHSIIDLDKIISPYTINSFIDQSELLECITNPISNNLFNKLTKDLPPLNKWNKLKPAAAGRYLDAKKLVFDISKELNIPSENIILPKALRELCWQDESLTEKTLNQIFIKYKLRQWQKNLLKQPLLILLGTIKKN